MADLTETEKLELIERPISGKYMDFTESQLKIRIDIAKKYCDLFLHEDVTLEEKYKEIYQKYPMWGFYKSEDGSSIHRIYGVCLYDDEPDKTWGAHTATCLTMFTNLTLGGRPVAELKQVDQWSDNDKARIQFNNCPGIFCDPLGFLIVLRQEAK